jgi:hypothetical protein
MSAATEQAAGHQKHDKCCCIGSAVRGDVCARAGHDGTACRFRIWRAVYSLQRFDSACMGQTMPIDTQSLQRDADRCCCCYAAMLPSFPSHLSGKQTQGSNPQQASRT